MVFFIIQTILFLWSLARLMFSKKVDLKTDLIVPFIILYSLICLAQTI